MNSIFSSKHRQEYLLNACMQYIYGAALHGQRKTAILISEFSTAQALQNPENKAVVDSLRDLGYHCRMTYSSDVNGQPVSYYLEVSW